jgi:arabinose-5-phosphate isomerase
MKDQSILAQNADLVLKIPQVQEASDIAAPTSSAVMMLALGDALMVSLYESKGFSKEDFKLLHPGGKIGANLLKVQDLMHTGETVPVVMEDNIMSDVLLIMTKKGFGTTAVIDNNENLIGIITDGDLRRHMGQNIVHMMAKDVMSTNPKRINPKLLAIEALTIMNNKNITSLLVEENDKLCGIIHIHDLIRAGVG